MYKTTFQLVLRVLRALQRQDQPLKAFFQSTETVNFKGLTNILNPFWQQTILLSEKTVYFNKQNYQLECAKLITQSCPKYNLNDNG